MDNKLPKTIALLALLLINPFFASLTKAQQPLSPPDSVMKTVDGVNIEIHYFSPRVRDRAIWGKLVPYDSVWRTGANNATTIEVNKNVYINGKKVPKGKYSLFTIPKAKGPWTVILNKVWDQWGAFNYDSKEDLVRFEVEPERTIDKNENMKFDIDDQGNVVFSWEYRTFKFPVSLKK